MRTDAVTQKMRAFLGEQAIPVGIPPLLEPAEIVGVAHAVERSAETAKDPGLGHQWRGGRSRPPDFKNPDRPYPLTQSVNPRIDQPSSAGAGE
jgi:hypothetical protein